MKRIVVVLVFFFFLSTSYAFAITPIATNAPTLALSPTTLASPTSSLTPTEAPIKYELPYPGILPDNPLYILKVVRDRVVAFLISDPVKKGEFYLLNADKRLNAGVFLVQEKKYSLAISTISKGINYFNMAYDKVGEARKIGKDVSSLSSRMRLSLEKHKEVLTELEDKVDINYKDGIRDERRRIMELDTLMR